ncbi:MAG: PQQ-dependent sugar dehydrogenase [Chloroflexota bacterium]|nr:PQQ-dependent sugar dehydrogenase [Chloroflexota bacterium]
MTRSTPLLIGAALLLMLAAAACSSGSSEYASPVTTASPRAAATTTASAPAPTSAPPSADGYAAQPAFPQLKFEEMLGLFVIPGDEDHAVLLTKDGMIRRVSLADDAETPATFLDMRDRIIKNPGQEEGLLGLAFSPDYTASGRFYIYYSAGEPRRQVISRFIAHGTAADASSEQVLLEIQDPFPNHNGGALAFGPDGYLYIGEGDGGSQGDPNGNGQNTDVLLAKILRLDVSGDGYTVPPDNPFASGSGRGEIYAYGLRNPWRFAFDPKTNELWVGDVGQGNWEEVDRVVKGGNYGWSILEGNHCYKPASGCSTDGLSLPRAEYSHDFGCSITGGYVYRGTAMPELDGYYIYGDYCSGRVWAVDTSDDTSQPVELINGGKPITSFAVDRAGEIYLVTFAKEIDRLVRK